jgi:hypothetical protein
VSAITGLARSTIGRGLKDLDAAPARSAEVSTASLDGKLAATNPCGDKFGYGDSASRMALGFNHAKTSDEKLAPRRPFVGLRADKWQVIVSIIIQNGAASCRNEHACSLP